VAAWNGKREAARALADAQAFLDHADQITIVTVQSGKEKSGASAADDVAAHLARKDLRADARHVDSAGRSESEAILAEAASLGADLIIMGGYGRSRIREFVFGGVTRDMIEFTNVPVLMSH
jgi:nucleotide-binding universal stress UspA family protein